MEKLLKSKSVEINQLFDKFHKKEPNISGILQQANQILLSYFQLLNHLEAQIVTIETNLYNYRKRLNKVQQKLELTFPNEFEQRTVEKYLPQIQRDKMIFNLQLKLIENILTSVQAQETHNNVKHIAAVQTKVEWLEVFFVSFYAAEFSNIIIELIHKEDFSEIGIVSWTALFGGLAAFVGLGLWRSVKRSRHFWLVVVFATIAVLPLIGLVISHTSETVRELVKSLIFAW